MLESELKKILAAINNRDEKTFNEHVDLKNLMDIAYDEATDVLADNCGEKIDGEILIPFFKEGGRFTFGDNHYVRTGRLIFPVAETEFAKDPTFGFKSSDLKEYIEEKNI